jgi:hypothetical protein
MSIANTRPERNLSNKSANKKRGTESLIGRKIVRHSSRPCKRCGMITAVISPGCGPHLFELRCAQCGMGLGWLSRSAAERIKGGPLSEADLAARREPLDRFEIHTLDEADQ